MTPVLFSFFSWFCFVTYLKTIFFSFSRFRPKKTVLGVHLSLSRKNIHVGNVESIDPRGRPTVTAGSDNCFCTCRTSVHTHFSKQNKFQDRTMFATAVTMGMAKWIID